MPYLETVQELLDDGTSLSTNLVLSWNELRANLRVTCGKLASNLRPDTQNQLCLVGGCKLIRAFYAILKHGVAYDPQKLRMDRSRPELAAA